MNLRGSGWHTTSLVTLSEFTPIILDSGEEKEIYLLIEKKDFNKVLERLFFECRNIMLEFSSKQREILSYQEKDGRGLCMPICKTQEIAWKTGTPRRLELQNTANVRFFYETLDDNRRIKSTMTVLNRNI
ncbi:hypothetical protein O181_133369 [Austropuccinia psidii MF-1]|uniref:Uncharacterized protein n=1 Tax=Austropuccinia psidii MF-1 TaxID=1389203 RepID=A0A9Q3L6J7_9BASI|nr:hypothetical protein [Austropuccinia psidii MF-1]